MSFENLPKEIRERIERQSRREEIWCPFCKHKQDTDTKYHHVTYWGSEGTSKCSCSSCGLSFFVKENVERTFKTYRVRENDAENEGCEGEQ
jgi:C4-type Zn-finger protein